MAEKKKKRSLLALLFLLGAGLFLVLAFLLPESRKPNVISAKTPEAEKLVNKHLWQTAYQKELAQEKMKAQNSYMAPQVGESIWMKRKYDSKELGIDHSPDTNEHNVHDDLNRYKKELQATHPDAIIQGQIADRLLEAEYTEAYRAEYARQFVENARRNGYHIVLDANFVVLSVTPIKPQERNPSLFIDHPDQFSQSQTK